MPDTIDVSKLLQWNYMSSKTFNKLTEKNPMGIYFLSDTRQIYRGNELYTSGIEIVDALPDVGSVGKIYVTRGTGVASIYTGSGWLNISTGASGSVTDVFDPTNTTNAVSAKGINDHLVANYVKAVSWDNVNKALVVNKNGKDTSIAIKEFGMSLSYDGTTGVVSLKDGNDTELSSINIPLDNFVESGTYNAETKDIELTLKNSNVIKIPASALIDVYTGTATDTAVITVGSDNVIKADIRISDEEGNGLSILDDQKDADGNYTRHGGLYVAAADLSGVMDKVATGKDDEILVAGADGGAVASGKKAGGATLAETPDENTLATEKAVSAIKGDIDTALEAKVDKTSIIGDAAIDGAKPSADKVISEAALVKAMSWNIVEDEPVTPENVNGPTL